MAPVSFLPYNLAGNTFVLFLTKQSPGSKYSSMSLNTLCSIIWGFICKIGNFSHLNYFYVNNSNTILFNLFIGFLLGLGYSLFELPNSFLKRRLNIVEGKNPEGLKKIIFIFLDQADSVFGCCLVVWLFYNLGIKLYLLYVLLGAVTHILVNMLLYFLHLRKNMF